MFELLTVDEVLAIFKAAGPTSTYAERLQRELNIRLALQQAQRRKDAAAVLEYIHMPPDESCGISAWIPRELYDELRAIAEGRE